MGMELKEPCKRICCPFTHTQPQIGSKGQNIVLLKVFMLHIKLKGMEHRVPRSWVRLKGQILKLYMVSLLLIEFSTESLTILLP